MWERTRIKVINAFKKLTIAAMVKRISNDKKGRRRTKVERTRSTVDNATVSTSGKLEGSSAPGCKNTQSPKQNELKNYCLENTAMMKDTPAKQ